MRKTDMLEKLICLHHQMLHVHDLAFKVVELTRYEVRASNHFYCLLLVQVGCGAVSCVFVCACVWCEREREGVI